LYQGGQPLPGLTMPHRVPRSHPPGSGRCAGGRPPPPRLPDSAASTSRWSAPATAATATGRPTAASCRPARRRPPGRRRRHRAHLPEIPHLERAEVAGPGFVNFTLAPSWYFEVLARAARRARGTPARRAGAGERIQVEFVSSNPNGPLHIGHGRGGWWGTSSAGTGVVGHPVERSTTTNDAGAQMDRFAASLEARYLQALGEGAAVPEDGYHGEYLEEWGRSWRRGGAGAGQAPPPVPRRRAPLGAGRAMRDIRRPWPWPDPLRRLVQRGGVAPPRRSRSGPAPARRAGPRLPGRGGACGFRSTEFG